MYKHRWMFCVVLWSCVGWGSAAAQEPAATAPLQVLFIGNSLTHYNNLPKMIAELAEAGKQRPLLVEQESPGGCTLEKHWKNGVALQKIQSRKWDYVVVQEYSSNPLLKKESMFEYGKKFDAEIKKQGAKTLLYMTWAYQDKPQDQAAIAKAYQDLAAEIGAEVVPVGVAWEDALAADPKPVLHVKDRKHPTPAGSYLAACVFYAKLFHANPVGLPAAVANVKLTDDEARPLQEAARKVVDEKSESKK